MKKTIKFITLELLAITIICSHVHCFNLPFFGKKEEKAAEETVEITKEIKPKEYLVIDTTISYSAGEEDNWAYGNQRKEFPKNKACYVRVSSTALYDKFFGDSEEIEVEYKITGFRNCKVDISDGTYESVINDKNTIIYKKKIKANKKKKVQESIMVFKYTPNSIVDDEIILEVNYGKNVDEKYNKKSTIYFK